MCLAFFRSIIIPYIKIYSRFQFNQTYNKNEVKKKKKKENSIVDE